MTIQVGRCLIPDLLAKKGWTQRDLSHKTGISEGSMSDYVTKRTIMGVKNAKVIAVALECTMDDLYEWIFIRD